MSADRWQEWMALLPCDRCGHHPDDCPCRAAVPASPPPPTEPGKPLRVLTLDERRAAYSRLDVPVLDVSAAVGSERQEGAA